MIPSSAGLQRSAPRQMLSAGRAATGRFRQHRPSGLRARLASNSATTSPVRYSKRSPTRGTTRSNAPSWMRTLRPLKRSTIRTRCVSNYSNRWRPNSEHGFPHRHRPRFSNWRYTSYQQPPRTAGDSLRPVTAWRPLAFSSATRCRRHRPARVRTACPWPTTRCHQPGRRCRHFRSPSTSCGSGPTPSRRCRLPSALPETAGN
mgnify:CR=1 FL=1